MSGGWNTLKRKFPVEVPVFPVVLQQEQAFNSKDGIESTFAKLRPGPKEGFFGEVPGGNGHVGMKTEAPFPAA